MARKHHQILFKSFECAVIRYKKGLRISAVQAEQAVWGLENNRCRQGAIRCVRNGGSAGGGISARASEWRQGDEQPRLTDSLIFQGRPPD